MTNPDYRAMCAELLNDLEHSLSQHCLQGEIDNDPLITRARALLAQPESQSLPANYIDPEHTGQDREVLEIFYTACQSEGGTADEIHLRGIRAVLDARALLDQPPADGEAAKLAAELRHFVAGYQQMRGLDPEHVYSIHSGDAMEAHLRISRLLRIAELLERLNPPQPIPVSERLPGPELCWWYEPDEDEDDGYGGSWTLLRIRGGTSTYTHWLPHWAIPIPGTP